MGDMLGRKFIDVLCRTAVCLACLLAIEMVACGDGGKLSQTIIGTWSIDIGGSRLAMNVSIQDLSGSLIQRLSEQGHAGRFRSAAYRIDAENADTLSISVAALGEFTVVRSGVTSVAELFFVSTHDGFMGAHPEHLGLLRKEAGSSNP